MPIDEHFLQIQATKFFTYGVLPELLQKWYSRLPDYTVASRISCFTPEPSLLGVSANWRSQDR